MTGQGSVGTNREQRSSGRRGASAPIADGRPDAKAGRPGRTLRPTRTRRIFVAAVLGLAAVVVTGCSELPNQRGIRPASSSTTQPSPSVPTDRMLRSGLLDASDVQGSWSVLPATTPAPGFGSACVDHATIRPSPIGTRTVEFSNGDSPPPVLAERLESFTAPNAADGYAELVHALSTCPTVHLALGGTTVSGTIASSGTAQLGVPSDAYQVVGTSAGATVDVGIVVFRRGPVLGALFYSSPSGDPVVLSNYARRAVDKLGSIG